MPPHPSDDPHVLPLHERSQEVTGAFSVLVVSPPFDEQWAKSRHANASAGFHFALTRGEGEYLFMDGSLFVNDVQSGSKDRACGR